MILMRHDERNRFGKPKNIKKTFGQLLKYVFKRKKLFFVFFICVTINAITVCMVPSCHQRGCGNGFLHLCLYRRT